MWGSVVGSLKEDNIVRKIDAYFDLISNIVDIIEIFG